MPRVMLPLLLVGPAAATSVGGVAPKCASLLGGVAASGHSDAEVAAVCRAAYTPEMCSAMRASLGRMPWPAAKIQETCQQWDARVKADDRGMLSYDELNEALENSANHKANLGYNMPRNSDGSVNVDATVQMKMAQTQSMVDAYNQYMGYSTSPPSQVASAPEQQETQKQAPPASRDLMSGDGIAPKCTSLLGGVAASGHSDAEVAAFCRAAYTPEMCSTMRVSLGRMPWPSAKIQEACQHWDARVKADDRGMMSYDELNEALENSANHKAKLGYNMPRNSDGSVNVDASVQMKMAQTQSMVDAYNQYMGYTTAPPSQLASTADQGRSSPSQDVSGLWIADRSIAMTGTEDARLLICSSLAALAVVAGVVVGLRITRSDRREVVSLLEDIEE